MFHNESAPATPIEFYRVPLACEAAPDIGCGMRSKPILAALEAHPSIERACLDRTGTLLAVHWSSRVREELSIVSSAFGADECVCVEEVTTAPERAALLARFQQRKDWYDRVALDQLSAEEARIIAERIMQRMASQVSLTTTTMTALTQRLAEACYDVLRNEAPGTRESREKRLMAAMLRAGRSHLDGDRLLALQAALSAGGHRPTEGEK